MRRLLLLVTLACAPICYAQTEARRDETAAKSFRAFLAEWEEARDRILEGDTTQWKQRASQGDDATIMDAFGGYEKVWKEVGPRYDWVAAQYKDRKASVKREYLSVVVSGDMAFTVAIER